MKPTLINIKVNRQNNIRIHYVWKWTQHGIQNVNVDVKTAIAKRLTLNYCTKCLMQHVFRLYAQYSRSLEGFSIYIYTMLHFTLPTLLWKSELPAHRYDRLLWRGWWISATRGNAVSRRRPVRQRPATHGNVRRRTPVRATSGETAKRIPFYTALQTCSRALSRV